MSPVCTIADGYILGPRRAAIGHMVFLLAVFCQDSLPMTGLPSGKLTRPHHPADHLPSLPGHHLSTVSDADVGLDVGERAGGGLIVDGYVGKNAPQRKPRFDPSYF